MPIPLLRITTNVIKSYKASHELIMQTLPGYIIHCTTLTRQNIIPANWKYIFLLQFV